MSNVVLTEQMIKDKTKVAALGEIRHLNLWGIGFSDVSIVAKLSNIEVLALAANNITSLRCFAACPTLQELYLRKNNVANLTDVAALKGLKKLHTLWLLENPCAKHPHYREYVLHCCSNLKQLDSVEVTGEERAKAVKKLTAKVIEEITGKASASAPAAAAPNAAGAAASTASSSVKGSAREAPASASNTPRPASSSSPPRTGRAISVIEERSASGKSVLFTTMQAQRAMLTSIVSLLPELTVESLELLEREVHSRVEKQRQQFSRVSQGEK